MPAMKVRGIKGCAAVRANSQRQPLIHSAQGGIIHFDHSGGTAITGGAAIPSCDSPIFSIENKRSWLAVREQKRVWKGVKDYAGGRGRDRVFRWGRRNDNHQANERAVWPVKG
jgi:hypothetical protein